jgi:alkaline phosphatase D
MRIAFASCMCTRVYRDQPVWDWIAAAQPDHLVLLGDAIYLDVLSGGDPQVLQLNELSEVMHTLYSELVAQPQFAQLVRSLPAGRVHAIWDDHDFLWNDAEGAEVASSPRHDGKIRLSSAFFEAFRAALAMQLAPGSFPNAPDDARFWDPNQPSLATPSLALSPDVFLHLTDGRTQRTRTLLLAEAKRAILGKAQLDALETTVLGTPNDTVHLLASGSTVAGWQRYQKDLIRLQNIAAQRRMLVLSGDIHRNGLDAFFTRGLPLHEATSSGAAVRDAVVVGTKRQNFGLVDISDTEVAIRLFKRNKLDQSRRLDRTTWLPI